jgi:hypothetical protein
MLLFFLYCAELGVHCGIYTGSYNVSNMSGFYNVSIHSWCFMICRTPLPYLNFQTSSKGRMTSKEQPLVSPLTQLTLLLCTRFGSAWTSMQHESFGSLCSWDSPNAVSHMARNERHACWCISSVQRPAPR